MGTNGALVDKDFAEDKKLTVGQTVSLLVPSGKKMSLRVVGISEPPPFYPLLGNVSIPKATFDTLYDRPRNQFTFASGGDRPALETALAAFPDAKLLTREEWITVQDEDFNQFLTMLYVLLALSVIVSIFGMVNTLVLSVFERTRELGMLRAVGMTRRQVRRMIRHESVITALIGAALGLPLGMFLAALVTQALSQFDVQYAVPVGQLVVFAIIAAIVGILAAILPAGGPLASTCSKPCSTSNVGPVRWAISGGAGFLGLHLARRLLQDGGEVRTLDVAPLNDPELEASVEELGGDIRDPAACARLVEGADVLVHAAAALPILGSREAIRSVNVGGTATLLATALDAGMRRAILISSTAVYGIPEKHPIEEEDPLVGVGHYGESKIEAEEVTREFGRRGLDVVIVRPKTFIGPERLGVFEILFDWIREGRRIYALGDGRNRYQLLAVEDLVEAVVRAAGADVAGETINVGAGEFGTVREDIEALIAHAGSASRVTPVPAKPAELALRALELARLSPLAEWHYKTAHRDSFVDISKAERLLGWAPRLSNAQALIETYDWYLANRGRTVNGAGVTHRVAWDQRALGLLKRVS